MSASRLKLGAAIIVPCFIVVLAFGAIHKDRLIEEDYPTVDLQPVRGDPGPMRLRLEDGAYKCSVCHSTATTPERYPRLIPEHASKIDLRHGNNDNCFNCHHEGNRLVFVAYDGTEIPAEERTELCKKCHGPRCRDWEEDAHGRASGYWDPLFGESKKLMCVQCHDPHAPAFTTLSPLPGPKIGRGHERKSEN